MLSNLAPIVVLACFALPANAAGMLAQDLTASLRERPVMKVVRLLQDMKVELNKELEDDKEVYEQLSCWCETNEKEKTKAIELGEAREAELVAFLGEAVAKMEELKAKLKTTKDEINADWAALNEASALRMKENKEFHEEETDLLQAVQACKQAIVVLSKHNPDLAQVRSVAQLLQAARVSQLVLSGGVLPVEKAQVLKEFLQQAHGATSFLAIPGFQSYAPQSGQIFGILKQMAEDFSRNLGESQAQEQKAVEEFKALKAAKEDEIASGKKLVAQLDAELAELMEKHAAAFEELEDVREQLELDRTFLANLKEKCAQTDEEYEARMKSRHEEVLAVEDTIKILNSDQAFDVFDKSVNTAFVQKSALVQQQQVRRQQAVKVLQQAAARSGSPQIALIAASVQLDTFEKVKEEIDKMVTELSKQQEDEIAQRDWCINELNENTRSTAAAYDKKASLETKIADLKKSIESLTANIASAKAANAEMQTQMKRASEAREAENADFQQTIVDQRLTQAILKKALDRMKQVYALLQQRVLDPEQPGAPHIQTSGTHTDPGNGPARFTKYEQHDGGSRVVQMIEAVIADSSKLEDEAIASEQDGQTAYENFMQDSNKSILKSLQAITNMSESRAKAKASLSMAETDFKQTMQDLENLNDMAGDLHKNCDYLLKNFDARQAARAAEIDALKEAKAILSGMK